MYMLKKLQVCNYINTKGATNGAGTAYPSGAPEFAPGFKWGSCYSIFSFMCIFYRSLFVLLYFFFWPLCCLFFELRILIIPLVSSNSTYTHHFGREKTKTQISSFPNLQFLINAIIINTKFLLSQILVFLLKPFGCLAPKDSLQN